MRAIIFIGLRRTWEDSHRKRDSFGNVIESFKTFDDVHMCSQVNAPMSEDLEWKNLLLLLCWYCLFFKKKNFFVVSRRSNNDQMMLLLTTKIDRERNSVLFNWFYICHGQWYSKWCLVFVPFGILWSTVIVHLLHMFEESMELRKYMVLIISFSLSFYTIAIHIL